MSVANIEYKNDGKLGKSALDVKAITNCRTWYFKHANIYIKFYLTQNRCKPKKNQESAI